jgi:hypothetical protein
MKSTIKLLSIGSSFFRSTRSKKQYNGYWKNDIPLNDDGNLHACISKGCK